jgi:hypothetical protein
MVEANTLRHPELVSGSIYQDSLALAAQWMLERSHRKLKRVQHDELRNIVANSSPLRASASPREVAFNGFTRRRGDAENILS